MSRSPVTQVKPPTSSDHGQLNDVSEQVRHLDDLSRQHREVSRSLTSQAAALRRDLALVHRQVEFERERRRELERLAETERLEGVPHEHREAVIKRDEDLRAIREEKLAMMEWLRRGVSEAQGISMEVESLRVKVDSSTATQSELQSERQRLEDMERRIAQEIEEATLKIKRLTESAIALNEHADHQRSLLNVTTDIFRSTVVDRARLQEDVDILQKRARDVETIEIAVGCMAASVRRALHVLERLHESVAKGKLADELEDAELDGYDSGDDADPTRSTPVVLSSTKAKMGRCEALLLTLQSSLRRFEHDEQHRQKTFRDKYVEELKQEQQALTSFKAQCDAEIALLTGIVTARDQQLRVAMQLRDNALSSGRHVDVMTGGDPSNPTFSLTDYYYLELSRTKREIERIQAENLKLAEHNSMAEGDYAAVKQLKREYRELEAKKMCMAQELRDAETENRSMKFDLFENKATAASPNAKARPPWKVTA